MEERGDEGRKEELCKAKGLIQFSSKGPERDEKTGVGAGGGEGVWRKELEEEESKYFQQKRKRLVAQSL